MKNLIILDYDNTLVDFSSPFLALFNKMNNSTITVKDIVHYSFGDNTFKSPNNHIKGKDIDLFFLENKHEAHKNLNLYEEVALFLSEIDRDWWDIVIITARHEEFVGQTHKCLKENKIDSFFDEIIYTSKKAEFISLLKHRYDRIIFVDDKHTEVERVKLVNPKVECYVKEHSYNLNTIIKRIQSLHEIDI